MPTLDRPDLSLYYEVEGRGPPLLMIAGFMSDHSSWAPLVRLLAPHFTCVLPDNRTTGRTTPWDAPVSIDAMCKDALALMTHLGFERYHTVGHSMGGIIALHMAQEVPLRMASTHIAASAPVRLARNTALFSNLITIRRSNAPPDTWLRAVFPWLFNPAVFDDPQMVDAAIAESLAYSHTQSADAMEHQLSALRGFDGARLAQPKCPTQVLLGALDLVVPPDHILAVLGHLPHHIVEGAGHSIHWDAPEAVAELVSSFARENPIKGELSS